MKKLLIMLVLGLTLAFGVNVASASTLPTTTWQVYNTVTNQLTVYSTDSATSAVCWEGRGQSLTSRPDLEPLYRGQCTEKLSVFLVK